MDWKKCKWTESVAKCHCNLLVTQENNNIAGVFTAKIYDLFNIENSPEELKNLQEH
jgi:hypothetical protein